MTNEHWVRSQVLNARKPLKWGCQGHKVVCLEDEEFDLLRVAR